MTEDPSEAAIPVAVDEVDTKPVPVHRHILLVDDVPANLIALEAALAPLGRPIITATSGRAALAHLLERDFSLLLLDVQMPDIDGFETARLVRSRARSRHLPIIFVTAQDPDPALARAAYELGAADFLHKPIEPEFLLAKASVFVTLQDRTEELASERLHRELDAARRTFETEGLRRQMEQELAAKEELARLNQALADLDRRKDGFMAILGHELRNPLAPIRTAIELIKEHPEQPLSARMIETLDRQTNMLSRLVEDLLDMSRITSSKLELRPERTDLRQIVDMAVTTSLPAIERRIHALTVEVPDAPVPIHGDVVRLVQVLTNLLNNAARYTERGGKIVVRCGIEGDRAVVRITDTGIGIPAEILPTIFDMFVQERVRSDGSGGLGLGLALARQLVELHRGSIEATSSGRGAGSTFEIRLPLEHARDTVVARTRSDAIRPLDPPRLRALRIAVIDDNIDARDLLAQLLRGRGHDVMTAADGHAGLALLCNEMPDVAIIDLGLPGLDGISMVERVRHACPALTTRMIALTGWGQPNDLERTKVAGFHAHLVKPATAAAILAAIAA